MSGFGGKFIQDLNASNYYAAADGSSLASSVSTLQSAGYQTASDVSGAISAALVPYEQSANLDADMSSLNYIKNSDLSSALSAYELSGSVQSDVAGFISNPSSVQTALDTRYEQVSNFDADIGDIIAQSGSSSQNSVNSLISSAISAASSSYESASDMAAVKSALLGLVQAISNNVVLKNSDGSDFSYSAAISALGG